MSICGWTPNCAGDRVALVAGWSVASSRMSIEKLSACISTPCATRGRFERRQEVVAAPRAGRVAGLDRDGARARDLLRVEVEDQRQRRQRQAVFEQHALGRDGHGSRPPPTGPRAAEATRPATSWAMAAAGRPAPGTVDRDAGLPASRSRAERRATASAMRARRRAARSAGAAAGSAMPHPARSSRLLLQIVRRGRRARSGGPAGCPC